MKEGRAVAVARQERRSQHGMVRLGQLSKWPIVYRVVAIASLCRRIFGYDGARNDTLALQIQSACCSSVNEKGRSDVLGGGPADRGLPREGGPIRQHCAD